jgi:lipoprotein-anchoring transpeptidase ErfK/SrfK
VPKLESASSKRRSRRGDILAVALLLVVLAGGGWLWWQDRHSPKKTNPPPAPALEPAKKTEAHQVIPSLVLVERKVAAPAGALLAATNGSGAVVLTNAMPDLAVAREVRAPAPPAPAAVEFPRPVRDWLEAQIALARRAISPGCLDGAVGSQTRAALAEFQKIENLAPTRILDTNTEAELTLDSPWLSTYTVTSSDVARLQPLGKTWLAKSQQSALEYENILQLVSEKAHAHPALIQRLNPGVDWDNVPAGTVLKLPLVAYPDPPDKAAFVVIHLADRCLEAFGTESNLLAHFPCSIAAKVDKRPVGELHVAVIAPHPNYTFDPAIFSESAEARAIGHKLVLPPGPKNPVGVAWIGLDKPGYGMHGTPSPEQIGRTESHGCFRLANWDAEYLVKLVWVGMPVYVEP